MNNTTVTVTVPEVVAVATKVAEKLGCEITVRDTTKNGISYTGISIGNGECRPTIYAEDFAEVPNEELFDTIYDCIERGLQEAPVISGAEASAFLSDIDNLRTRVANVNALPEGSAYKVLGDTDLAVVLKSVMPDNECASVILMEAHLKSFFPEATFDELLKIAINNCRGNYKVENIARMLEREQGLPEGSMPDGIPMFVVTNNENCHGAQILSDTPNLEGIILELGIENPLILPSSIHEIIIVDGDKVEASVAKCLVKDVNANEVKPTEKLADNVYVIEEGNLKIA